MKFVKGSFYTYTGKQRKSFYKIECVYADEHTAVMVPYYPLIKELGKSYALPQSSKQYDLDANFNSLEHRLNYYMNLRDAYMLRRDETQAELSSHNDGITLLNHLILDIKDQINAKFLESKSVNPNS